MCVLMRASPETKLILMKASPIVLIIYDAVNTKLLFRWYFNVSVMIRLQIQAASFSPSDQQLKDVLLEAARAGDS